MYSGASQSRISQYQGGCSQCSKRFKAYWASVSQHPSLVYTNYKVYLCGLVPGTN